MLFQIWKSTPQLKLDADNSVSMAGMILYNLEGIKPSASFRAARNTMNVCIVYCLKKYINGGRRKYYHAINRFKARSKEFSLTTESHILKIVTVKSI